MQLMPILSVALQEGMLYACIGLGVWVSFRVLAFPANNFGSQEPGTNAEIKKFCTDKYNVTFDLFSKVSVKGDDICDLYKYLTEQTASDVRGEIKWNFQKYLVNRKGEVTHVWSPRVAADDEPVTEAIEAARAEGILAVEMEAAALYAFAEARRKPVLCFAHVTNQMGQIGDFEKGEANGATAAIALVHAVADGWLR